MKRLILSLAIITLTLTSITGIASPFFIASAQESANFIEQTWVVEVTETGHIISDDNLVQVERIAEDLLAWSHLAVVNVVGYTDNEGGELENILLSLRRADAVSNVLAEVGVRDGWIQVDGFGELDPIAENTTPEGRARNRRVVITAVGIPSASYAAQNGGQ